MEKKITTIYVSPDILEYCKDNKISLSEWVDTEFSYKFLSVGSKYKEIENAKNRIEELTQEIEGIKARRADLAKGLTTRELRFIGTVKPLLRQGFELNAIKNRFNEEHKRNFSLDEFRALVEFYEEQLKSRVEHALRNKKKNVYPKNRVI